MIRLGPLLLGLAAILVAAGPIARAENVPPAAGSLGKNLADEPCQWSAAKGTGAGKRDIACGAKAQSAGSLWSAPVAEALPKAGEGRREAILRAAKATPAGLNMAARMACDGGQWLGGEGGSDTALFTCVVNANSWPSAVIVSVFDATLYQAEGLPTMTPVLIAAIADAAGRPPSAKEAEAAVRLVEARLPRDVTRAGGADFASYKELIEVARLYSGGHNYAGAEAAYRRALDIETRLFGGDATPVGETLAEIGLQVSNQGRFDEAAGLFRRATPIIEAAPSVAARARLAAYLALDAANQRHFADALKFGREATSMRRAQVDAASQGGKSDPLVAVSRGELAHSLRIEAEMDLRLHDLPAARAAAAEALQIISDQPGLPLWWRPDALALVAEINGQEGRVVEAEREYREAVELQQRLFGDTAPTALTELRLGRFYTAQQLYPAAVASFRSALAVLRQDEIARADIVADQIIPFFAAAAAVAASDPAQRAALEADVFRASQLINSGVADLTIARAAARLATDTPAIGALVRDAQAAQRQRDTARIELAAETAKPDDARDAAREAKLGEELRAASTRADELSARLLAAFPDYARFSDPGPVELGELQKQLHPGEAFLSFVIGETRGYALLVTQERMTMKPLDIGEPTLGSDVADLRKAFVPRLGTLPSFDLAASFALYRRLIGPVDAALKGIDHLVAAPSGALASLPLALLVTEPPRPGAERAYGEAAWLVRRLALTEVPSARALIALRAAAQRRAPAPRPLLAVGNPLFTGAAAGSVDASGSKALDALAGRCRENGPVPAALLRGLPPLPETAAEVRTVGRLLDADPASLLLGADATESNFRAHPLDQYAVLYFATHGLLPGELHCQSEPGLVLSPPPHPATTTGEDGLLDASEIAELKLNADLVVLSACNTAAGGGRFGGEALAGLADAFFNAGARTVLASHWEVPSAATAQLMTGVFERIGRDRAGALADALRQSQLAVMTQPATAHPFYWAAFTIIGEGAATPRTASAPAPSTPNELTRGRS